MIYTDSQGHKKSKGQVSRVMWVRLEGQVQPTSKSPRGFPNTPNGAVGGWFKSNLHQGPPRYFPNTPNGSWGIVQVQPTSMASTRLPNTLNGSWGIVQVQPTSRAPALLPEYPQRQLGDCSSTAYIDGSLRCFPNTLNIQVQATLFAKTTSSTPS
jgi:hypothetical protein